MPQVINTNIASISAQRNLNKAQSNMETTMNRLSSGMRINSAKDDAAGNAISTRFDSQIRGLSVAIRNSGDGISMAQTAEGGMGTMVDNLQRVRELALQAANATNSDLDREALNAEAQQLIAEVGRVSDETQFNGIKLLDGSFTEQTFQIGANQGETFSFNINGMTTDKLGAGLDAGVSAQGTDNALAQGDLVINGVVIGASLSTSDTASTTAAETSAIAKVAAINEVSSQTGVTAEVNVNQAAGTTMATSSAATSGTIALNGTTINITVGGDDLAADRAAVIAAINAESDRTGVTAVDTGTNEGGIVLETSDGRNIDLSTTMASTGTGLAANGVYEGGFTLRSDSGDAIDIQEGTGDITNTGLVAGSYESGVASVSSDGGSTTSAALSNGDLVINDVVIGASLSTSDTASSTLKDASAIAKAAAINDATDSTGVTAVVNENVVDGAAMSAAANSGTISINGVSTATVITTTDATDSRAAVVDAINAISGQTGVTAVDSGNSTDGVILVAEDGRNIDLSTTLASAETGLGANNVHTGSYTLESASEITISAGTGTLSNSNLKVGVYGGAESGQFLKDVDISTVDGANKALEAVDNALESINSERGNLGAIQNRLESTISNLEVNNENLSAAQSRIRDTDFASETAQLSRSQVLQQAGMSMLSQANSLPQNVLSLLR
ncbi:MAG: flagellin [Kangiellaceae bacterium]|nr:flagellin [Kangiellaceae bacterium]|tara:strand:+ start:2031 stop:4058 length:2028 start_codon:yes stop_codon:yes gene_type:complete